MSRIEEFTGVAGIPPVGMGGRGVPTNPKLRAKRAKRKISDSVDSFISGPSLREDDETEETETEAPAAPTPKAEAVAQATAAAPAPAASAPAASAPVTAESRIMLTREVVEALSRGQAVNVRGVTLDPVFKPAQSVLPPVPAGMPESAAASMLRTVGISESVSSGETVDMNAAQPPPAPSTDGKVIASAFRRFGGPSMS